MDEQLANRKVHANHPINHSLALQVAEKLFETTIFRTSETISCYISKDFGEIDTSFILKHILMNTNKQCYVPRVDGQSMFMERLNNFKELEEMPRNKFHIREPKAIDHREEGNSHESEIRGLICSITMMMSICSMEFRDTF